MGACLEVRSTRLVGLIIIMLSSLFYAGNVTAIEAAEFDELEEKPVLYYF